MHFLVVCYLLLDELGADEKIVVWRWTLCYVEPFTVDQGCLTHFGLGAKKRAGQVT